MRWERAAARAFKFRVEWPRGEERSSEGNLPVFQGSVRSFGHFIITVV